MTRKLHTTRFLLSENERKNYSALLVALWPSLVWRHAGFGALQAYIKEGNEHELRVHLWHFSLVKSGIEESGLCHDHRFNMRSSVLVGGIRQTEFRLDPLPDGKWQTHKVLHAREAMAQGGFFHQDPQPTKEYFNRFPVTFLIDAGKGYTFDKFVFHETRVIESPTITLVEKFDQEDCNARILAPRNKPIVHAFTETWHTLEQQKDMLAIGLAALKEMI